ncbi:MAG: DUF2062 domain-containing protein [Candidatus Omnitrophota bacterium]|jgi:hypothetical protein
MKKILNKLFTLNDSPQKISLGLGLGALVGVMPGIGMITTFVLASFLRINRAAAILGCLATNTWITFIAFILSIKLGSSLLGLDWHSVYQAWKLIFTDFHFNNLFKASFDIVLPLLLGYFIVGLALSVIVYLAALIIITTRMKEKK